MKKIFPGLFLLCGLSFGQTKLVVLFTNNVNGQLENCICVGHPYGALEKQKVHVDKFRKSGDAVLYLSAGDMLSAFGNAEKDSFAVEQVKLMEFDGIVPGDQEFSNGMDFFRNRIQKTSLPLLAANLSLNGEKPFAPYKIKQLQDLSIALIGVISPGAFNFFPKDKIQGLVISDYREAIRESLEKVKNSDFVILLSHLGYDTDLIIAREFPAIHLIVGGHTQTVLQTPELSGTTYIVQAGNDGYYLGQVEVSFDSDKKPAGITGKLTPMNIDLPNDPQISHLAKLYNLQEIHRASLRTPFLTPVSRENMVSGSKDCQKCHSSQLADWEKSPHAHSWDALVKEGKTKLMQCISCHTTGFGRLDGFMNVNLTKNLSSVNCSECHWISPEHLSRPSKTNVRPVQESNCVRCHDSANSPKFQFAVYREKAIHKKLIAEKSLPSGSSSPAISSGQEYIVKEGDTLTKIAFEIFGSRSRWIDIYEVNKEWLRDPDLIYPNQKLQLPR